MNSPSFSDWRPPPGFVQVESRLPGVTVYAPAPQVETGPEARDFKCPQCGGITAFDPTVASVACPYCGFVQALAERADVAGRAAAEREFTLENLALAARERGWGEERRELHCDSCGADLSLAADDLSSTCPFCDSNRVVARVTDPNTLRPRFLIPFKIAEDASAGLARAWLGRGWMHPGGLANAARSARLRGLYLPFWTFDATIRADWKAEVGYERTRRHYDGKRWKTRRYIDWRWESGHVTLDIDDLLRVGTTRISQTLLQKLQPFDMRALTAYEPDFLAGWSAQAYDVPLPAAWDAAKAEMREQARRACRADIPSSHVRNFSMTADFDDETWRYILLPVFIAAYRFQGKAYQVLINGQTGQVAGQKPVAWWKVWAVVAGLLAPGVLLGLFGLPLLAAGGVGLVPLVLGGALFVIGLIIAATILRSAMEAGEA